MNRDNQFQAIVAMNNHSFFNVIPFYPFSMNAIIMLPLLPTIRPSVFSYDATHSLGTHSFGIKIEHEMQLKEKDTRQPRNSSDRSNRSMMSSCINIKANHKRMMPSNNTTR